MSAEHAAGNDSADRVPHDSSDPEPVPLVDLSELLLSELPVVDRPELASCLERLVREAMDPGEVTSGFNAVV
jgi:hypothetical protein